MEFTLERYPSNLAPEPILIPRKNIAWEAKAVFNPSVVHEKGKFVMLYRSFPNILEQEVPRLKRPGFHFKNQISYIGYAESTDGIHFERRSEPFIRPSESYDNFACEDPRITKIGDTFYITYTAIDGSLDDKEHKPNIRIALATTKDFVTVKKHGVIGPPTTSKAAAFFPDLIGGKIALLMTVSSDSTNSRVCVRYYDSPEEVFKVSTDNWNNFLSMEHATVLKTQWWLHRGPELGAPPIKTDKGWLVIFSTESMSDTWNIGAALLNINNPEKVIARTAGYVLQPVTSYEREGLVPNVTFPEGAVIIDDMLYVYYGCADTVVGLATCKLKDLLEYLNTFKNK